MNIPQELLYTETHEWVRIEDNIATIGITDHAQNQLSELVFAELPPPGKKILKGQSVAVVESVKAASDIYAPLSGQILESNSSLQTNPALINSDPYGEGWLFKILLTNPEEINSLLKPQNYLDLLKN
ncbi:MAG: glycine cleavage system protein GcvH [Chthoniobacterales bacterium]|nr:glycine cleavage system protein GcvH [Chthoniobacterales bacterium]